MTLWRLEWLRLVRTRRIVALFGVYLFFGATAPLLARYINEFLQRLGNDIQIVAPAPKPIDGFTNYVSNANQVGLLVFALVISSSVAIDAQREMATFLRMRVSSYRDLLLPKYLVNVGVGATAFAAGALVTCYGTVVLLGSVDAVGVLVGIACTSLYLAFIGAVAAALGARLSSVVTTAVGTLVVALLLGLAGTFRSVGDWLPSHLLGALTELPAGGVIADFGRSAAITVLATIGLLALAVRGGAAREM